MLPGVSMTLEKWVYIPILGGNDPIFKGHKETPGSETRSTGLHLRKPQAPGPAFAAQAAGAGLAAPRISGKLRSSRRHKGTHNLRSLPPHLLPSMLKNMFLFFFPLLVLKGIDFTTGPDIFFVFSRGRTNQKLTPAEPSFPAPDGGSKTKSGPEEIAQLTSSVHEL